MLEKKTIPDKTIYKKRFSSIFIFLLPLAIFRLSDSILSYIFPIVLEGHVNSNIAIGLIMALSSVVGLICDFVLPQIFPNKSWKFLLVVGILASLLFPVAVALGDIFGLISMFVIAVVIWGIYYEFILFTEQSFVVNEFKKEEYSKTWGVLGVMIDLTGIIAPILGSMLLIWGTLAYSSVTVLMNILALIFTIILITTGEHESKNVSKVERVYFFS